MSMSASLQGYGLKLLLVVAGAAVATGQTESAAKQPSFEVASVKPAPPGNAPSRFETNIGTLRLTNQTLRGCIRAAYGGGGMPLKEYQVIGGPKWVDSSRYDIVAKADSPAKAPQLVLMLQALLAERFKLAVHRESRPVPGYALVVAKGGLKVKPQPVEGDPPRATPGRGSLTFERAPIGWMPRFLSNMLGVPVLDEAEVTGLYSFKLEWSPDEFELDAANGLSPRAETAPLAPQGIGDPSLFAVLEERVGVKLEPRKVPVDVIVIDRAEKAIGN